MEDLVTPEVGINTFQVDMAGEYKMTDKEIMAAMDKIAGLGGLAMLYAENGAIIQASLGPSIIDIFTQIYNCIPEIFQMNV